jgi:hypothetical protein
MREEPAYEEDYKGCKIKIYPDCDAESPRDWDNLGTMICMHRRYNLGDKHNIDLPGDFASWDQVEAHLIKAYQAFIILPLYLYDHSGLTMRTYPFECRWDSGQVGFIYITKEKIKKEMARPKTKKKNPDLLPIKHISKKIKARAMQCLIGEVETYDKYLRGDVYGYVVEDADENHLDSCYGFYGLEDCIAEAKSIVDWNQTKEKAA